MTVNQFSNVMCIHRWNGDILGNIITLCLCANYIEEAFTIAKILFQKSQVTGVPSIESLDMLLDACIKTKNLRTAMVYFLSKL